MAPSADKQPSHPMELISQIITFNHFRVRFGRVKYVVSDPSTVWMKAS